MAQLFEVIDGHLVALAGFSQEQRTLHGGDIKGGEFIRFESGFRRVNRLCLDQIIFKIPGDFPE